MIKVESFDYTNITNYRKAIEIRRQVFVIEQNIDEKLELDEFDILSKHYLAIYNNVPIGTARWRQTKHGIKLERFAVLSDYRNKNIGKVILEKILNDITPLNKAVYLDAQISAVNFYLKNGFITIGNHFFEAGIEHVKMEYKL